VPLGFVSLDNMLFSLRNSYCARSGANRFM
jgi:hypothetical protein